MAARAEGTHHRRAARGRNPRGPRLLHHRFRRLRGPRRGRRPRPPHGAHVGARQEGQGTLQRGRRGEGLRAARGPRDAQDLPLPEARPPRGVGQRRGPLRHRPGAHRARDEADALRGLRAAGRPHRGPHPHLRGDEPPHPAPARSAGGGRGRARQARAHREGPPPPRPQPAPGAQRRRGHGLRLRPQRHGGGLARRRARGVRAGRA